MSWDIKRHIADLLGPHVGTKADRLAELLVTELGLHQEWSDDIAGPDWARYSRWVTKTVRNSGPSRLAAGLS
jgi:hypothetical protein